MPYQMIMRVASPKGNLARDQGDPKMIHTVLSRYIGFAALGCGLIATVIYVLMISVTLAHIEAVSGQVPFDMRPLGTISGYNLPGHARADFDSHV